MERLVIVIVGPTCSGKTSLSIELARELRTEILSADSRQVFKHLNIGTAKPKTELLNSIKHHFIDSINIDEKFNASIFEEEALKIIENLFQQKKIPIVVGGSGLYIQALVDGIFNIVSTDDEMRNKFLEIKTKDGVEALYNELKNVDPVSAAKMLPQNWKRVTRALEVYYSTGRPIWELQQLYKRENEINFLQYGLDWDREQLYSNIELRVDEMIKNGLVEEVNNVLSKGYSTILNAINTVGYKEIIKYLENEISLDEAISLIKRNTRRFAKRQLTWFRKDKRIKWIPINDIEQIEKISTAILEEVL
ncbi:MAG: tRNA (adenosine(37)-N6)-dimethylallyltransferase MiaA [Chlorobiaceae bacterium]|nr:tRNA (adenosine(37)-N6)-dimethylallyltransferase MiaA [Chlorobiaceae bacterium]MBA4308908.1 tRNA (adenosine(37)-N6)-dimethylallyltransferase MiaA [Chlorobiaceae bacterium]